MAYPYSLIYTVSSGDTILAVHHNDEHDNHIDNNIPESTDDYSSSLSEMQTVTDPFPSGTASLATTLAGELERLRYVIKQITGEANWYVDPDTDLATLATFQTDVNSVKSALSDATSPAGTAADVNTRFDQIVSQIKLITGETNWYDAPDTTISALSTSNTSNTNSVTYLKQNQRNILVNGGLEVWQRATSFSSPASGTVTADKWIRGGNNGATFTVARESTEIDTGTYSMKVDVTDDGGVANFLMFNQIENYKEYAGKTLTASARVKTSNASKVKLRINDGVGSTASSYHTGGGGWETLTVTRTISASVTSDLDIGIGVVGGEGIATTLTYYIDSVIVVIGSEAATFAPEDPALEMARCERYYEARSNFGWQFYDGVGSSTYYLAVQFATKKSAIPTITLTNGTTAKLSSVSTVATVDGFVIKFTTTAGTGVAGLGTAATPDGAWTAVG